MMRSSPLAHPARRGVIAVLVAICLTAMLGVLAIALEGGLSLNNHRRVQAAADAAALEAAGQLYSSYTFITSSNPDPSGTARQAALASVAINLGNEPYTAEVNIPPRTGIGTGQLGTVEVIVRYAQPRYFSKIWGSTPTMLSARAVGRGQWTAANNGIIVLDPHQSEALKANGGVVMTVRGASVINNSDDPQGTGGDGSGSVIKVENAEFYLTGGVKSNTTLIGPVNYRQPPTPDPLAYLVEPSPPSSANPSPKGVKATLGNVKRFLDPLGIVPTSSQQVWILEPGRYDNLPNFTNQDIVILRQASWNGNGGIYYLNNSGFVANGANVFVDPSGESSGGVMFFNAPTQASRGFSLSGGADSKIYITPLTSGIYKGIAIFQKRSATATPLSISGQGSMAMSGTFYVAGGAINVSGNDSTGLNVIGSQYISRTLSVGGNGKFNVSWDADLTGRSRVIGFLE